MRTRSDGRLGNLVLLQKTKNTKLGNKPFATKRETLKDSELALTKQVAESEEWTPDAIEERQKGLAEVALKVWPRQ